jgi:hypothetical protein
MVALLMTMKHGRAESGAGQPDQTGVAKECPNQEAEKLHAPNLTGGAVPDQVRSFRGTITICLPLALILPRQGVQLRELREQPRHFFQRDHVRTVA